MKITVAGTGYVGLITGVGLASQGHDVNCIDIVKEKVKFKFVEEFREYRKQKALGLNGL